MLNTKTVTMIVPLILTCLGSHLRAQDLEEYKKLKIQSLKHGDCRKLTGFERELFKGTSDSDLRAASFRQDDIFIKIRWQWELLKRQNVRNKSCISENTSFFVGFLSCGLNSILENEQRDLFNSISWNEKGGLSFDLANKQPVEFPEKSVDILNWELSALGYEGLCTILLRGRNSQSKKKWERDLALPGVAINSLGCDEFFWLKNERKATTAYFVTVTPNAVSIFDIRLSDGEILDWCYLNTKDLF